MRFSSPLQYLERGPGGEVSESPVYDALDKNDVLVGAIILSFLVILLCSLREVMLIILWRQVIARLNSTQDEAHEQINPTAYPNETVVLDSPTRPLI